MRNSKILEKSLRMTIKFVLPFKKPEQTLLFFNVAKKSARKKN
jgi:hypothetical protein